jgi:hypothetical protein
MTNTLGVYNPLFYANEALIQLESALGMASRIHMGYDEERRAFGKGEVINIRRPGTFTAQDAPSTAQDVATETVAITLEHWKEVKFKLTDKELAFTGERIINDHIRPAAFALADFVDVTLNGLWYKIPHFIDKTGSALVAADIPAVKKVMRDNKVPMSDLSMMHMEIGPQAELEFLSQAAFTQHQGAGLEGVEAQRTGYLARKYGYELFTNQNVVTSGTVATNADLSGTVVGAHAKGVTSVAVTALTTSGTIKQGDAITINGYKYAITADLTLSSGAGTVSIFPALKAAAANSDVVTLEHRAAGDENLAFHRNAFALATAPLSEVGNQLGAKVATVQDPVTGLAIRSRMYYVGNSSEVHVALDILFGLEVLDERLAVRMTS